MPTHLLSDVEVVAISIVDKGANRKKIYLRKQEDAELHTLPAPHRLLKAESWDTFYCVVAEPDWREDAGAGSPGTDVEDVWKDAGEIRRAAHKFMRNGALVNRLHESLDPYGDLVENFIAQADMPVGEEVIKEGSWVVGIQPTDEGRAKIDSGEFTGISIQGTGLRTEVAKDAAVVVNKPGVTNWVEEVGGLPKFIADIAGDLMEKGRPESEAIRLAIGICRNFAAGHDGKGNKVSPETAAKAQKALAEYEAKRARAKADNVTKSDEEAGVSGTLPAVEQMEDDAPITVGWFRKILGLPPKEEAITKEAEVSETTTPAAEDRLASAAESIEKSVKSVETLAGRLADIAEKLAEGKSVEEAQQPTAEEQRQEVYHRLDEVSKSLDGVKSDLHKLAQGDTTLEDKGRVEKKSTDPLAGLLD